MASSQIAAMLDELMGRNRNVAPNEKVREMQWSDPEVCKFHLVHTCPHDLFVNTKVDLGPCGKIHDDALRTKFRDDRDSYKKSQFQEEFLRFCQRMLTELDTRIRRAKERLHLTQTEDIPLNASGQHRDTEDKVKLLSGRINQLCEDAEQNGNEGNVETAQGLMKLADQLREERAVLIKSMNPFYGGRDDFSAQQKAMQVCDTCGAFLIVGDAQQRVDDHLTGKQHIGYSKLKEATDAVAEERKKYRLERDREMEERRKEREEARKRDREARDKIDTDREQRKKSKEHRRSRSRDRDGRRRSSGSSSSRKRSRSRSRSRKDRDGGSSSSSRRRRSRSRDEKRRKSHEGNGSSSHRSGKSEVTST